MTYRDPAPPDDSPIALGRPLQRFDLRGQIVSPFAASDNERWCIQATPDGLEAIPGMPNRSYAWPFDLPLPDLAFAATATLTGTPTASFKLLARCVDIGSTYVSYGLHVRPALSQYRFELLIWAGDQVQPLIPWTMTPALKPDGRNEVELRTQGDSLLPVINGHAQMLFRDASLGRGRPRLAYFAANPGDRFLLESVRAAMVE